MQENKKNIKSQPSPRSPSFILKFSIIPIAIIILFFIFQQFFPSINFFKTCLPGGGSCITMFPILLSFNIIPLTIITIILILLMNLKEKIKPAENSKFNSLRFASLLGAAGIILRLIIYLAFETKEGTLTFLLFFFPLILIYLIMLIPLIIIGAVIGYLLQSSSDMSPITLRGLIMNILCWAYYNVSSSYIYGVFDFRGGFLF